MRVIPNKVYQSLACGRPVITCDGPYPDDMRQSQDSGVVWVPPNNSVALAEAVSHLAASPDKLINMRQQARCSYERYFSNNHISLALLDALKKVGFNAESHVSMPGHKGYTPC